MYVQSNRLPIPRFHKRWSYFAGAGREKEAGMRVAPVCIRLRPHPHLVTAPPSRCQNSSVEHPNASAILHTASNAGVLTACS